MFVSPDMSACPTQGKQRIILDEVLRPISIPFDVPIPQVNVTFGKILTLGRRFCSISVRMKRIASMEKTPAAFGGLEQHAVASRVWRTIGHAMLYYMNVNAGPQRFMKAFFASTFHYLLNGEIASRWVFPVEKSHSNPDLVSDFQLRLDG